MISDDGSPLDDQRQPTENKRDFEKNELLKFYLPTPTLVYRKVLSTLPDAFKKSDNGDSLLQAFLTQKGKVKYLDDIRESYVRVHAGGLWSSRKYLDKWVSTLKTKLLIFKSLAPGLRRQVFEECIKAYEMASWDADHSKSTRYWYIYNRSYLQFCLISGHYGKAWLITRRIIAKALCSVRISVVIPVFNVENHLLRAIDSVLCQPEVEELILAEDGSSDKSLKLCLQQATMDSRIVVLQHPGNKNKGVAATRNLGIKNARGPYIAFLDADDYYLPQRFKQTQQCFAGDSTIDGVYEMIGVDSGAMEIQHYSGIKSVDPAELFEGLQPIGDKLWFSIDGLTVKKSIFERSGFFDESLTTSEDTLQWFKMASVATLVAGNTHHPVTITERRIDSLTSDLKLGRKNFVLMLFKLFEWCKKVNCKNSRKELVLNCLFFHLSSVPYRESTNRIRAIYFFLKIMLADPGHALLRSNAFRRYSGNLIGFNRVINFFNKDKPAEWDTTHLDK